jgi:hypothetical protein
MEDKNKQPEKNKDTSRPDPETLHTTDPQEKMRGPVSSTMHKLEEKAEDNDSETREEANRKRDENV